MAKNSGKCKHISIAVLQNYIIREDVCVDVCLSRGNQK